MKDDKVISLAEFNKDLPDEASSPDSEGNYDAHADLSAKLAECTDLASGMIIGFTKDGEFIMLPSQMTFKDSLWLNEVAKVNIIR